MSTVMNLTTRTSAAPVSYLFVPGNRPERFDKALAAGAELLHGGVLRLLQGADEQRPFERRERQRERVTLGSLVAVLPTALSAWCLVAAVAFAVVTVALHEPWPLVAALAVATALAMAASSQEQQTRPSS